MILGADMVLHIFDPTLFSIQPLPLRRQLPLRQTLSHYGMFGDMIHPLHARGEDLGVNFVAEIPGVDFGRGERVGGDDVHGTSGERVFQTHEQGDLLFA